jgi:hypothetical protein
MRLRTALAEVTTADDTAEADPSNNQDETPTTEPQTVAGDDGSDEIQETPKQQRPLLATTPSAGEQDDNKFKPAAAAACSDSRLLAKQCVACNANTMVCSECKAGYVLYKSAVGRSCLCKCAIITASNDHISMKLQQQQQQQQRWQRSNAFAVATKYSDQVLRSPDFYSPTTDLCCR